MGGENRRGGWCAFNLVVSDAMSVNWVGGGSGAVAFAVVKRRFPG